MTGKNVIVELRKVDLSYLVDFLVEDLRAWSEKGFEDNDERRKFQRIADILSELREAKGANYTLFL